MIKKWYELIGEIVVKLLRTCPHLCIFLPFSWVMLLIIVRIDVVRDLGEKRVHG